MDRGKKDLVVVGQEKDAAAAADTPPPRCARQTNGLPRHQATPKSMHTMCVFPEEGGGKEKARTARKEHCAPRCSKSRWHGGWGDGGYCTDHRLPV